MIEYGWALPQEENELLDFGNLVFSISHAPTDFRKILPRVYGRPGFSAITRVAREDGKVIGMVAFDEGQMEVLGQTIKTAYIGTVSTHPYHREKGIMKRLMPDVMEALREKGVDFVALDGQRQRYMFYGFENAGERLFLQYTRGSLMHALPGLDHEGIHFVPLHEAKEAEVDFCYRLFLQKDCHFMRSREDFLLHLRSWQGKAYLVKRGETSLGYVYLNHSRIAEFAFENQEVLPAVLAAFLKAFQMDEVELTWTSPLSGHQALFLAAHDWHSEPLFKICVFNWQNVLTAFLRLKAARQPLKDGSAVLDIKGHGRYFVEVSGGQVSVSETQAAPDLSLTSLEATRLVFLKETSSLYPNTAFYNWFPLPLPYSYADAF